MPRNSPSSSSSNLSESESSDSVKIFAITVENLSANVTEDHLKEIFNHFGNIHSCGIRQNEKKYAVINYGSKENA